MQEEANSFGGMTGDAKAARAKRHEEHFTATFEVDQVGGLVYAARAAGLDRIAVMIPDAALREKVKLSGYGGFPAEDVLAALKSAP